MPTNTEPIADRTRRHYTTLLAPIYRWMVGDFPAAIARSQAELRQLGVEVAREGERALDLGAGLGLQTIPLVDLGYDVTALDSSEALLAELSRDCPRARSVQADLTAAADLALGSYQVIVCMGDTLTHLRSTEEVLQVLGSASARLAPGGLLILTFRDYAGPARQSTERFLLVQGDADRILTCHLDYGVDKVLVTDLLHERSQEETRWWLRASDYEKLRLPPSLVASALTARGLALERCESIDGRVAIAARRGRS
jgi:2-polyprenyl-3-methyl-5-hydroxy-6-metoxy-1,4-benzoquinol methylase